MQELREGTSLKHGEYVIKRLLGQGGFGITYLAEQVSLGREVAIKEFFMMDGCMRDVALGRVTVPSTGAAARVEQFRKKFFKEAQSLACMDHPNIIGVIDVFEENGTVYYSMPYMANGSLKSLVQVKGRLSESEALRYINQVASALKYMHDRHLCHYDVKPDNILIDNRNNAVLIDFGISKNYDADGNETSTTPIGLSEGYAPIEQYQGISGFSPASDVYALGATLYYLLVGQIPPSAVDRVQGKELVLPKDTSKQTRLLIEQSMALQLNQRSTDLSRFLVSVSGKDKLPREETVIPIKESKKETKEKELKEEHYHGTRRMIIGIIVMLSLLTLGVIAIAQYAPGSCSRMDVAEEEALESDSINQSEKEKLAIDPIIHQAIDDMVRVAGGTFTMGATPEQGSDVNIVEKPAHEVTLRDYYISKYEVTQELWQVVMGYNPSEFKNSPQNPVENVSWDDCQEFIAKLNELTGKRFRLPTEAEWEFAARGGDKSRGYKYSGSDFQDHVAWYYVNSDKMTHPVGQNSPNELGLYDMSGNVWEWCQDWYGRYSSGSQTNPSGPSLGSDRVSRGGSWRYSARYCRVSNRSKEKRSFTDNNLGLRLALSNKD